MSAFPLCCEPRHEAPIRRLIEGCVAFVRERLAPRTLVGVVLTGSFARGEGSVVRVDGRLKVLGDIEFFVVLPRGADCRRAQADMARWGLLASAAARRAGLDAEVEFGPMSMAYVERRVRPTIFTYDLRHHGKVLWGPADLLEPIPAFRPEEIPRQDALWLLLNRTIEQLEAWDRIATLDPDAVLDVAYQRIKIVLDLAGSALAFSGRHEASYAERPAAFARLVRETPSLGRRLPPDFERELAHAARVKLAPGEHDFVPRTRGPLARQRQALRADVVAARGATLGLLSWELGQLVGVDGDLAVLLERYLGTHGLGRRVREWAKLALNPLPSPAPLSVRACLALFRRATPRALVHAAGALAYRELGAGPLSATIARLLPIAARAWPSDAESQRRAIVAFWRWCVRNS